MLKRRVRVLMHTAGMSDDNMGVGADNGTINVAHEQMAAKEWANLRTPEHVVVVHQLDGDR